MSTIGLNKNLVDTKNSGIADVINKANQLGKDVIRLEVGDVDLEPSHIVLDGLMQAVLEKKTHYPSLRGDPELIEEIVASLKNEEIYITPDQILITSGGSMGMYLALHSVINIGEEVLVFEPVWPHLTEMIKLSGGIPISLPLTSTNQFHVDINDVRKFITPKTKAILINTPNNPTGVVYSEAEIYQLCRLAKEYNLVIISDEEYSNYIYGKNKLVSPISIYDKAIVSRSFSKTYSISGLRLGYIIAPAQWVNEITKWSLFSTMYSSSITQRAVLKALQLGDEFPFKSREIFEKRMNYVVDRIRTIKGISCFVPEGAVYIWIKFDNNMLDDYALCDKLLYEAKVAIVPGSCFGLAGAGYARLSLGQDISLLDEAITRIEKYCAGGALG